MKRLGKILMVAALAIVSYSANAELAPQWSRGTVLINVNGGVLDPGCGVSADVVIVDQWWKGHFTIGGEMDLGTPGKDDVSFGITPRVTYGLNITPKFEVHAAVGLGVGARSYKVGEEEKTDSFTVLNDLVGLRFFFTDNLALFAESGYSYRFSYYRLGLSLKF
jgi:hypothetical protein